MLRLKRGDKLNKLEHIDTYFSTLKYALFNWVYQDFYVKDGHKNIKIVPKDSINKFTTVSKNRLMDYG